MRPSSKGGHRGRIGPKRNHCRGLTGAWRRLVAARTGRDHAARMDRALLRRTAVPHRPAARARPNRLGRQSWVLRTMARGPPSARADRTACPDPLRSSTRSRRWPARVRLSSWWGSRHQLLCSRPSEVGRGSRRRARASRRSSEDRPRSAGSTPSSSRQETSRSSTSGRRRSGQCRARRACVRAGTSRARPDLRSGVGRRGDELVTDAVSFRVGDVEIAWVV
jgi:hypothetical protein